MLLPGMGLVYLLYLLLLVGAVCGGVRDKEGKKNKQLDYTRRLFDVARTRGYVSVPEREQEFVKGKICIGTNGRWSVPSNREHHYRNLKNRYTNCTYVDGNLELTWLQDQNFDLSFLQYIREVTGYVLISHVDLRRVVLPHLQIIRGRTLFKMTNYNEEFAIIVTTSKMYSLELPALRDVLSGSVGLFSNYNLCHVKTINWDEIISDPKGRYVYRYNFISPERECPPCHKNCEHGCWGEGEENCQKFSKVTCSPQCYQGRCFGSNPRECCHLFCAGGCIGPKQSDCIACKNFYDDGVCTQECPPMQIYNPITYSWEPNPHGKYAYGATCVKNCPEHLLKDNGACVKSCPLNKKAVNGECIPCNGPCPKTCRGDVAINAANIDDFKDCTVIEGYIHILENSFTGYQQVYPNSTFGVRYPPMHPSRLEVFSTLKEITGFLNIQAYHSDFKNLSYFRNLEIIGGRTFHDYFSSLYIVKTSLESLELKSLKRISSGTVAILENKHLCFADGIKWRKIIKSTEHMAFLQNNKDPKKCVADGLVCDQQCSNDGCWGPGPEECLSCAHFSLGNTCLQNCTVLPRIYKADDTVCQYCHEQCGSSCTGPGPEHCATCKHFRDGPYCVSKCPITKYENNDECKLCHSNCVDGCTGPKNTVGPGACNSCDKAVMNENATVDSCLHKNESCPSGYFFEWVRPQEQEFLKTLSGKAICRKCHPRCRKCTGYGFHELVCQECTSYKKGEQCEDECPSDYYADDATQNCLPCHQECRGCKGPGPENCLACYNFKVYPDGIPLQNGSFTCMSNCPPDYPHKEYPEDNSDAYCSEIILGALEANLTTTMVITIATLVAVVIIVIIVWLVFYYRNEMKVKENAIKMSMALTGLEDNEPLRPTNALPNLAKLRIIKEEEMRRGGILGFGAFGTVYKGVWIPEGETSKIPVAIKILRDDTGTSRSKEFLEEAYIMATVNHPNLLELLAVCMTSPMMLVTQLMPLGCSLDFVRNNRNLIGSKLLLNWCTQIARGMAYLEEKRLVHRDLAARNVLLQNRETIRITDFGLAKLLDINEDEYKADGGKMPIKWLALECIQHRIFTHKSDVWAFGVTIWELLTFGGKPYENVPARNVPELLEKGERLPQPIICTIDVYMIMIKCWMLDAESRPSFTELEEDFTKMSRDPGRFLVIPGDRYLKTFQNQDEKDIRHLGCSLEHSSSQSEGDECMQPKSRAPISFSGLGSFFNSPQSARIKFWPSQSVVTSDGSCAPQNQHNWNQERLRYAQRHGLNSRMVSLGTAESDCSSIKCSSDGKNNDIDEYDSGRSEAQVGTLKLQLPVDEDDYLMPSPQQTQGPSTYVDLIEESVRHSDNSGSDSAEFCKTNIDNPEYLLNNDSPTQVVGIPTVSQVVQSNGGSASCDVVISVQQPQLLRPPSYMPQKSSEEESDHEYYNDFDRLKRELQPLQHRSETTV